MKGFKNRVYLLLVMLLASIMLTRVHCQIDYVDGEDGQDRGNVYDD